MKKQIIQVKENKTTISSLEVAEMVEKPHNDLMKNIRRYTSHLDEGKISHVDFWRESNYTDVKGEIRPCYLITKKGCEFIAHKTTGVKGTLFTARYINRFHEMEDILKLDSPTLSDNRLELLKIISKAKDFKTSDVKELYPEYFGATTEIGSLEYIIDSNTSYLKWKEDYNITKEWIGDFPTIDIYNNYVRYCIENRYNSMGKKNFYHTIETDFGFTKKQKSNGYRYFISE